MHDPIINQIYNLPVDTSPSELLTGWRTLRNAIAANPRLSRNTQVASALDVLLMKVREEQKIAISFAPLGAFLIDGGVAAIALRSALSCSKNLEICSIVPEAIMDQSSIVYGLGKALVGVFLGMGGFGAIKTYWQMSPTPLAKALDEVEIEAESLIQRINRAQDQT